jgi:hypothetical protein
VHPRPELEAPTVPISLPPVGHSPAVPCERFGSECLRARLVLSTPRRGAAALAGCSGFGVAVSAGAWAGACAGASVGAAVGSAGGVAVCVGSGVASTTVSTGDGNGVGVELSTPACGVAVSAGGVGSGVAASSCPSALAPRKAA